MQLGGTVVLNALANNAALPPDERRPPARSSCAYPDNIGSRRVAEKNGMKIEKETVFRGFPTLAFAITREDWLAKDGAA
jgi:hypothetical protein